MQKLPSIKIKYEDGRLIVIEKPSGLLSMSTDRRTQGRPETTAYSILTQMKGRVFIVHRLDRDTSGVMIFAKDEETKRRLQDNWDEAVEDRRYIAVVEGIPPQQEGTVTSWLSDNPKSFKVSSCPYDNGGQKAVTHYKVIDTVRGINMGRWQMSYSLVEFNLETGRKNQIRVHAAVLGTPIAGDKKYGAVSNPAGRLCLHARNIAFIHPFTGRTISVSSAVPAAFRNLGFGGSR